MNLFKRHRRAARAALALLAALAGCSIALAQPQPTDVPDPGTPSRAPQQSGSAAPPAESVATPPGIVAGPSGGYVDARSFPHADCQDCVVDPSAEMARIRRKVLGKGGGGSGWGGRGGYSCPTWYVEAEAMWLDRDQPRETRLAEDQNGLGPIGQRPTLLTSNALDYHTSWGPRLTLGHWLDDCRRCELTYYGLQHWQQAEELISTQQPFNISFPFDTPVDSNFDGAQRLRVVGSSDLNNLEWNWLNDNTCAWAVPFHGLRYFAFHDEIALSLFEADGRIGLYDVDTDNHLLGYQVGALVDRRVSEVLAWNVQAKAGAFVNFARQSTFLSAEQSAIIYRDVTVRDEELAFVGDLSFNVECQLTRCLALTVGYQLLWVDGLALAPEQLDFTTEPHSGAGIEDDGDLFFHGGYVGFRILF
jgi:hypothetical protein